MGSASNNYLVSSKSLSVAPSPLWHPVVGLLPEQAKAFCVNQGRFLGLQPNETPPDGAVFFSTFGALGVFVDDGPICVDTVLPGGVWGWGHTIGRNPFRASALTLCEGFHVPAAELRRHLDELWLTRLLNANETLRAKRLASEAACNAMHTCLQRVAKWILRLWRSGSADNLKITQSFMAEITGFQRTSVNAACGALQDRGVVRVQRGRVTVVNEALLSRIACGCDAINSTTHQASRPHRVAANTPVASLTERCANG